MCAFISSVYIQLPISLYLMQGPNKKILCQLSMLERRMAQGKDLSSVLFFCFLLVPLEYNLPYLLKHKKLLFCFLLWLHYTWVLGSLGVNLWNALYFRFGMFGPFIYMRFYSSQNLTVWAAATRTIRAEGSLRHYLSASTQMWATTHNDSLKEKMSTVVSALSASQDKMGTGYLSAFPSEQFDRFKAIKPVWAPYYTIHEIMAGLLDQYILAENAQALKMLALMVDYFYNRVLNVITKYSVEKHYLSLNEETGGMNDVLYKLYAVMGDWRHLLLAHLFDKTCFL
ncbi:unnamed protein product [Camellia sinensis]